MNRQEPIAIVGIGCRYPDAPDVESFWDLLVNGREARGEYPSGRFGRMDDAYAHSSGRLATSFGGFLSDIELFDAEYFGISPREAISLDPQQRLLLEAASEALDDAGQTHESYSGSRTGVFLGVWTSEWEDRMYESGTELDFYVMTGSGRYSAAGRLSYIFGLEGPSLTVDTACSSSLVAVHLACQSVATGESEMALAGGVNVILGTELTEMFTRSNMLSRDGRCKFGDASADGFVRSEGAGVVVLKRLARAVEDRDPIYAVVRGTAVNNDGRSCGLMVTPSRHGQERMIRDAIGRSGVALGDICYVEAHGTGTSVGDPVELQALNSVFDGHKCLVGSVKTNIGHTEGAAGVAGLIKAALVLKHRVVPPNLHFKNPNPGIPWATVSLSIPTAPMSLERGERPLAAGVSSFGITGTNAHAVLAEPPPVEDEAEPSQAAQLLLLSAHNPEALKSVAGKYAESARARRLHAHVSNICYTAAVRRTHHDHRLAMVIHSQNELVEQLDAFAQEQQVPRLAIGCVNRQRPRRTVFVFPGQGSQWIGMGRELLASEPAFAAALSECDEAIREETGWSALAYIKGFETPESMDPIDVVQPVLFGIEVSLAALWRSWGVQPNAVVGHSMGEVAAVYVAGALSLKDAVAVICRRSQLLSRIGGRGSMAVVGLPYEDTQALIEGRSDRLSVGANNSPDTTVVSGDTAAIDEFVEELELRSVFCRRIKVDVAAHSPQVEPLLDELRTGLSGLKPRKASIPIFSTVTEREMDGRDLDADYWAGNMRHPVMLSTVVTELARREHDVFVEMSPHPILLGSIESGLRLKGFDVAVVPSLKREHPERASMLAGLGMLFTLGVPVDWKKLYPEGRCVRLPGYAWQKERYWPEEATKKVPDYVYELQWVEDSLHAGTRNRAAGPWVILGDADGIADRLKALGGSGVVVAADGVLPLLDEAPAEVVCLCSRRDVAWVPEIVRAITAAGWRDVRLSLVTQRAVAVGDLEIAIDQAPFWGVGRVVAREHPELCCRLIDVGSGGEQELDLLARVLWADATEDQVAVRGGKRYAARYRRWTGTAGEVSLRRDASYLITGGTGGVGLAVAEWMAQRGAGHIVLAARRAPADEALAGIRGTGAEVHFAALDVRDRNDVARVIEMFGSVYPPLKGIVHAAAVIDDGLIVDLTRERFEQVMRTKALGAWNLHECTQDFDLDLFVMFSSVASICPQPGHGSYAAANASLDGLAHYRRAQGKPALSINWSAWEGLGLAKGEGKSRTVEAYRMQGMETLSKERALYVLDRILRHSPPQVLVLPADWGKFAAFYAGDRMPTLFSELAIAQALPPEETATGIRQEMVHARTDKERRAVVETYLKGELSRVLKLPVAKIPTEKPLGTMGLDSLMALEFVRRLAKGTGLVFPATVVFNYPTIAAMTDHVVSRLVATEPAAAEVEHHVKANAAMAGVAAISDEEALQALMGRGEA